MTKKKVWQYQCDWCGKHQYRSMEKHEAHCTMNPHRKCGMCELFGMEHDPAELLAILPEPIFINYETEGPWNIQNLSDINTAIKKVYQVADGCPACVLAAIRQRKIPVKATEFDYKSECKSWWSDYNEERRGDYYQ